MILILFYFSPELPTLPGDLEMEVANVPLIRGLPAPPAPGHKTSKKEAKLVQQRLERLARLNHHLPGKANRCY